MNAFKKRLIFLNLFFFLVSLVSFVHSQSPAALSASVESIGRVGPYTGFVEAREALSQMIKGRRIADEVEPRLDTAGIFYRVAQASDDPWGPKTQELIKQAKSQMQQAWALAQYPLKEGIRGAWVLDPDGVRGLGASRAQGWRWAAADMRAMGLNTLFVGAAWAGVAFYSSAVLPVHGRVAKENDALVSALGHAHGNGLKVYAVVLPWDLADAWLAPFGTADQYGAEGRLQVDSEGRELAWLCPCDARNQKQMLAVISELAALGVDGIHLHKHLLPGAEYSYSQSCRQRFERRIKQKLKNWPVEVVTGPQREAYRSFLRSVMTEFVKKARAALQAYPQVQLSATVLASPRLAREVVSQDWQLWLNTGLLDFVVTVAGGPDGSGLKSVFEKQHQSLKPLNDSKIIQGVALSLDEGKNSSLESAVAYIRAGAQANTGGVVLVSWRDQLVDTLAPFLGAGFFGLDKIPTRPARSWPALDLKQIKPTENFEGKADRWRVLADPHQLGTWINRQWHINGGPAKSNFALRLAGHLGEARAPWPYAFAGFSLDKQGRSVNLESLSGIEFMARGDGAKYELVLVDDSVANESFSTFEFRPSKKWKKILLRLKKEKAQRGSVREIRIRPVGRAGKDFELWIDDFKLLPRGFVYHE